MKKFVKVLLVMCMIFSIFSISTPSLAAPSGNPKGYITMSADVNTLGAGFLYEPVKVPFYTGETYADVTDRFLGSSNYRSSGQQEMFYLSRIKLNRSLSIQVPQILQNEMGMTNADIINVGVNEQGHLGEFDYSSMSGWMYSVNNEFSNVGVGAKTPKDGDVCRWQFTLTGFGADLGQDNSAWGGSPALYVGADRSNLLTQVAQINSAANKAELLAKPGVLTAYNNANAALTNLTATQEQINNTSTALTTTLNTAIPASSIDISTQLNASLASILAAAPSPGFGTLNGEWTVLSLSRSGYSVPKNYFSDYYNRVVTHVQSVGGILSTSQYTEYSRLTLALSAIGKSSTNVGGYNLLENLANYEKTISQGINGAIFALIALDTNNYEIPIIADTAKQATRQKYIDFILSKEVKKDTPQAGGFTLYGSTPDPDITGMVLQALAPYKSQPKVETTIDRAVKALSTIQKDTGGFTAFGSTSSESIAQVIVGLTALGIDPATDSRFVKSGGNLVSALLTFYVEGGGFKHIATGNRDGMATDQGTYALIAYDRFVKGKNSLYNMTDAFKSVEEPGTDPGGEPKPIDAQVTIDAPDQVVAKAGNVFNAIIKTDAFPVGDYKLMDGVINIPDELSIEDISISERMQGGSLAWNYNASDKKLRFVYTNSDLKNISLSGEKFPAELLTLQLKVKNDIDTKITPNTEISVGGISLKKASNLSALVFDSSKAVKTVKFSNVAISIRKLFEGDGIDLIPANKKAIAFTIGGIKSGTKVKYKNADLIYSSEMTAKRGVDTYVLMTNVSEADSNLLNSSNYSFLTDATKTITFGDIDANGIINAQDALNVISAWLRKVDVSEDEKILRMNVTSDSRINTFDALAIMENYVSQSELAIIGK
ncbi:DUF4430 domain-containing protein [Ectobacillus sp. JY-23]|uniref:DUF4430 domain-containing protein n=1 Tax=Ectobacillus sp. JY-23 TaxID=2933872 RepID=UPI001FF344FA|nr:DUF4430 domain-containing protein [Ectobacillus sp. JY-23]UOY91708.1 DUF4430 domain-containing protein [Ectobacillus sp. JY-23]